MPSPRSPLSGPSRAALATLAGTLRAARLTRRMTQAALAERLGVSRHTVLALERGDPGLAVGTVLEAAWILGVPLLADDARTLAAERARVDTLLRLLPASARSSREDDDDV